MPKDNHLYFPRAQKSPLWTLPKYRHQNNLLYPQKRQKEGWWQWKIRAGTLKEYCLAEQAYKGEGIPEDLVCLFGLPAHLNRSGSFGISLVSCIQQWCTLKSLELRWKCPHLIQLLPIRSEAVYGIIGKEYQTAKHSLAHNNKFHNVTPVLSQSEEILHKTWSVENLQLKCHDLNRRMQLYKVTQGESFPVAKNSLIPKLPGDGFLFL